MEFRQAACLHAIQAPGQRNKPVCVQTPRWPVNPPKPYFNPIKTKVGAKAAKSEGWDWWQLVASSLTSAAGIVSNCLHLFSSIHPSTHLPTYPPLYLELGHGVTISDTQTFLNTLQLIQRALKAFPGQIRDVVLPACPRSFIWVSQWDTPETPPGWSPRRHST